MTTTTKVANGAGDQSAPPGAFRFFAETSFANPAAIPERTKEGIREYPVSVVARRGGVVDHWYWGRIVHNLSGCRTKDRVAFDWCHSNELIGYADDVQRDKVLTLAGKLISVREDDRADEVGKKGSAGIPYESSIFWDPYTAIAHFLKDGMSEVVNGAKVEGPCYVIDEWDLRGQAICPYGVDAQTSTSFAEFSAGLPASVPFRVREAAMSDTAIPDVTKDISPETATPVATTVAKAAAVPAVASHDDARAMLKSFRDKFGPLGADYFADGLTYEQALEKHVSAQDKAIADAKAAKDAAEAKLAAIPRGAEAPTTQTGSADKTQTKDKFFKAFR